MEKNKIKEANSMYEYFDKVRKMNAKMEGLCSELEDTIYIWLDNYKDEAEFKYKKLKQKQLSVE